MQYLNSCCLRSEKESCLEQYPIAMAYVPWQKFDKSFSLCHALKVGTIFPCLEKTFCGKGGRCRRMAAIITEPIIPVCEMQITDNR